MIRRINSLSSPLNIPKSPADKDKSEHLISSVLFPDLQKDGINDEEEKSSKGHLHESFVSVKRIFKTMKGYMNSTRLMVLLVLCLQNSIFTLLRRYSQGVLKETYSKHELLLVSEIIKILYSVYMIKKNLNASVSESGGDGAPTQKRTLKAQLIYLVNSSQKMLVLALIYGAMNILSFVSLRNISAGMFTIFAQTKILTTATFSTIMLRRQYSWTKWRALVALLMGVLLFSEPIWGTSSTSSTVQGGDAFIGILAVLIEVTLSGFASIYFEKVIKTDAQQLGIWERNFQLALGSMGVYIFFIVGDGGGAVGFFGGWSPMTFLLSVLCAAGGLLVALSIKYGDSILKTLATTGAIILTGILDHMVLGGPLTPSMMIAGVQVIIAICNYSFDASPAINDTVSREKDLSSKPAIELDQREPLNKDVDPPEAISFRINNDETEKLLRRV
jgi:UDP-sugar transporter A1/2/3